MARIFISYRRDDSAAIAGWIHDKLLSQYGAAAFIDVNGIAVAEDFGKAIGRALRQSDVVVAIIGPEWLGERPDGTRRIDDPEDWVRTELTLAFQLALPVIPVLVEKAQMPAARLVPEPIRDLVMLSALAIDPGPNFRNQIDQLAKAIDQHAGDNESSETPTTSFARQLLTARTLDDLQRLRYAIDAYLARTPNDVDVRRIRDKVDEAIQFERQTAAPSRDMPRALPPPRPSRLRRYGTVFAVLGVIVFAATTWIFMQPAMIAIVIPEASRLIENPNTATRETVTNIQRALCVPTVELGTVGPLTLQLARIYQQTDRPGPLTTFTPLTNRDVSQLLAAGECPPGFRNYFERKTFPKSVVDPDLIRLLNRVAAGGPLGPGADEIQVRSKIAAVRKSLALDDIPPQMADQMTPDLMRRLLYPSN